MTLNLANHRMNVRTGNGLMTSGWEPRLRAADRGRYLDEMLPFNLHTGLILEDTGLALRWCDERDTLTEAADYWQRSGDSLILAWQSRRMFGGLHGNVTTKLPDAANAMPTGFMLGLSCAGYAGQTLAMAYNHLQSELITRFGRAHDRHDRCDAAEATWKLDGITIRHEYWDGFGGDHYVLIYPASKTPNNNADRDRGRIAADPIRIKLRESACKKKRKTIIITADVIRLRTIFSDIAAR
jgi:hypothetical protein